MTDDYIPTGRHFQLDQRCGRHVAYLFVGEQIVASRWHKSDMAARFAGYLWLFCGFVPPRKYKGAR